MLLDFSQIYKKYNLQVKGVLHIGAHYGQEDWVYRSLGINNIMYFEPIENNFKELQNRIGETAILHKLALGNDTKKIKMFVETANQGMSSSILKPNLHVSQYPHIVFDTEEEVDMVKLDDVNFQRDGYNMINIDVQGYELEVFKGSVNTLEYVDVILAEINKDHLYENGALINDLISFLEPFGFELVEENWAGGNWGDGLFIKK
jgi:FkbM family methyltransferase